MTDELEQLRKDIEDNKKRMELMKLKREQEKLLQQDEGTQNPDFITKTVAAQEVITQIKKARNWFVACGAGSLISMFVIKFSVLGGLGLIMTVTALSVVGVFMGVKTEKYLKNRYMIGQTPQPVQQMPQKPPVMKPQQNPNKEAVVQGLNNLFNS